MFARLIPSMFLRRVLLLGGLLAFSAFLPVLQLIYLTVVRGEEFRRDAERKLVVERWLPTQRGRILDRKGRVLAFNRPSYDIAVDYPVITGEWARDQAARHARSLHRAQWSQLSRNQQEELINRYLPQFQEQLDASWTRFAFIAGLPLEEINKRREQIQSQVELMAASIWEAREQKARREILERLERRGEFVDEDADHPELRAAARQARRPIREQTTPHVVLRGVDDKTAFAFAKLVPPERGVPAPSDADPLAPAPMPGLHVIDSQVREYPFAVVDLAIDGSTLPANLRTDSAIPVRVEGVATHILGWMRSQIYAEDIAARPKEIVETLPDGAKRVVGIDRGHYQPGDSVGAAGLEASLERELRGLRGFEVTHLDTGEIDPPQPPEHGRDIPLTIDIMLQARIQALFDPAIGLAVSQPWHANHLLPDGAVLSGAAVVIDIDSGDILAMVSAPSFTLEQLQNDPKSVFEDELMQPFLNRAINRPYQPGSVVKPLMLVGALTGGQLQHGARISCTGRFYENKPDAYRCWIYKMTDGAQTHDGSLGHAPDGAEAIMVSCNIFFYELGRRLGPKGLTEWFTKFGVGRDAVQPALGLGEFRDDQGRPRIFPGALGPIGGYSNPNVPSVSPQDAVLMAIGQGPIAWTPLHAADAYATLGRMGLRIVPRLRADEPVREYDLGLDPRAIDTALRGLHGAVAERAGTGYRIRVEEPGQPPRYEEVFNAPGIKVWGKTGTADAAALFSRTETDENGKPRILRDGDHSWTVILCGPEDGAGGARPRYAVAVVVDYGGSGGKVSGPIANQIVHALIAEGYLPDFKARTASTGAPPRP